MKKTLSLLWIIPLLCLTLSGCSGEAASSMTDEEAARKAHLLGQTSSADSSDTAEEILIITEDIFASEIEYINFHPASYVGKTIQYEGIYAVRDNEYGDPMSMVYRSAKGHSHGGVVHENELGFEIFYDGSLPEENDWVEVTGTLEYSIHGGMKYLSLRVSELNIKENRGKESLE